MYGSTTNPSRRSAEKALKERAEFDAARALAASPDVPVFFTGTSRAVHALVCFIPCFSRVRVEPSTHSCVSFARVCVCVCVCVCLIASLWGGCKLNSVDPRA